MIINNLTAVNFYSNMELITICYRLQEIKVCNSIIQQLIMFPLQTCHYIRLTTTCCIHYPTDGEYKLIFFPSILSMTFICISDYCRIYIFIHIHHLFIILSGINNWQIMSDIWQHWFLIADNYNIVHIVHIIIHWHSIIQLT